jgi:PTH1 family peptidyl-tRNA hydrolase
MKLVVGLGNPGRQYDGTRHNIGYDLLARLAQREACTERSRRFSGQIGSIRVATEKVWLLWPETFMNLSGHSVQPALAFYGLEPQDLLVICDDLNLPLGQLRVRKQGSDGGQKGLRSIIAQLGRSDFPRLRIGIGPRPPERVATDFVLQRFSREERETIERSLDLACDAVLVWCSEGIEPCMNRFNAKTRS